MYILDSKIPLFVAFFKLNALIIEEFEVDLFKGFYAESLI